MCPIFLLRLSRKVTLLSDPLGIFSPHSLQPSTLLTSSSIWNSPFLRYQDITAPCFLFLCLVHIISPGGYCSLARPPNVGFPQASSLLCVPSLGHLIHSCCFGFHIYADNPEISILSSEFYSEVQIHTAKPDLLDIHHFIPQFPKFSYQFPIPKT